MTDSDLEAAAAGRSTTNMSSRESQGELEEEMPQESRWLLDQSLRSNRRQYARLYRVAQRTVEAVVQSIPALLQNQLREVDISLEMLANASIEGDAVLGAQESALDDGSSHTGKDENSRGKSSGDIINKDAAFKADPLGGEERAEELSQQPGHLEYRNVIVVMTESALESENANRRRIRRKWRTAQNLYYIEDPWKALWDRQSNPCGGIIFRDQPTLSDRPSSRPRPDGVPELRTDEDLNMAWSSPLPMAEKQMRYRERAVKVDVGSDPFFGIHDLNLRDLQEIGRLQIEWTDYWDEHLRIQTDSWGAILKLYWFSPDLSRYFQIKREKEEIQCQYGEIGAPIWLWLLGDQKLKTWANASIPISPLHPGPVMADFRVDGEPNMTSFCWETDEHTDKFWMDKFQEFPYRRLTYAQFPYYHERLRILRHYMDFQQPRGLWALWRDRRNSNAFYTFWIVIIFGAIGIVLAGLSLVVAILQAWAQVISLQS
ncbi:MAG: hypothetical protein Q9169_002137 [Polycauliona sp. 2 TL-2023]